ncbi:MAG: glycosyltransferase family 39 protein, partial [Clostridia bacterium]|nr:glycosyltransferase family 39 protein [Clostridia bacterium]
MDDGVDLDTVWINLGSIDYVKDQGETLSIYTSIARTSSLSFQTLTSKAITANSYDAVKVGAWRLACENTIYRNYPDLYFLISTLNTVKINEVAFVGKTASGNSVLLSAEAVGAGAKQKYTGSGSAIDSSSEFSRSDSAKALAAKLIDEQGTFDVNKIDGENYNGFGGLSYGEAATLESVRNLTSGRGFYVNGYANPLGYYFIALGTSVFGANLFGLRIMPLLFTLGSVFVAYFIGKLLFGKLYGVLFSALFAVGGYSLFFATVSSADASLVFFILLAFYFGVKFVRRGISSMHPVRGYLNIALGGAATAVALAVKTTAIFCVLPILGTYAFGVVKQYLYAKSNESVKTAEYKRKLTATLSMGAVSYVIFPILFLVAIYLIAYPTFSEIFGTQNVFAYGSKAFYAIFSESAITYGSTSTAFGYIINYSAHAETAQRFVFGNIILTAIGFFSLVYCLIAFAYKKEKGKNVFNSVPDFRIYVLAATLSLMGWLLSATLKCTTAEFYLPSVFINLITVIALKDIYTDLKVLQGKSAVAVKCITAVLALAVVASFALAVPAYLGLSVDGAIYSWQVLGGLGA